MEAADAEVAKDPERSEGTKKRGGYGKYSPEFRAKVAKYALENGDVKAVRHFSSQLDKKLNESVVRNWRGKYVKERDA
jgi:transposase-like protein